MKETQLLLELLKAKLQWNWEQAQSILLLYVTLPLGILTFTLPMLMKVEFYYEAITFFYKVFITMSSFLLFYSGISFARYFAKMVEFNNNEGTKIQRQLINGEISKACLDARLRVLTLWVQREITKFPFFGDKVKGEHFFRFHQVLLFLGAYIYVGLWMWAILFGSLK